MNPGQDLSNAGKKAVHVKVSMHRCIFSFPRTRTDSEYGGLSIFKSVTGHLWKVTTRMSHMNLIIQLIRCQSVELNLFMLNAVNSHRSRISFLVAGENDCFRDVSFR